MAAILTMTRDGFGIELHRGRFDAMIDGNRVASLDWHDTAEVSIDPGHDTLRIHAGRYSSRQHSFDVADGDSIAFQLHGANLWPVWAISLVKPDPGISLKQVAA
ncbi:MAG TPA: hypothetical protein VGG05_06325 [Pseudonocardiaceae bacterium]